MPDTLPDRQRAVPDAATGVSVTPSGSAWGNSAWVELSASMSADSIITGVVVRTAASIFFGTSTGFEVDIGVGAASSEVVVATFRDWWSIQFFSGWLEQGGVIATPMIGIDAITSGDRVSVRLRKGETDTSAWLIAMTYLEKPLTGTMVTTANPLLCLPAAANSIITTPGTPWANSAWTQLRAASGPALIVVGVTLWRNTTTCIVEIDIGIGGSGSETVAYTIAFNGAGADSMNFYTALRSPWSGIAANDRITWRARSSAAGGANVAFSMSYFESPL